MIYISTSLLIFLMFSMNNFEMQYNGMILEKHHITFCYLLINVAFTSLPFSQKLLILNVLFHYHVCCTISNVMFLLLEIIAIFYTNKRSNGNLISTTLRQMLNRNKVQKLLAFCKVIRDENIDSTKIVSTYINRSLQIRNSDRKILKTKHDELNYQ